MRRRDPGDRSFDRTDERSTTNARTMMRVTIVLPLAILLLASHQQTMADIMLQPGYEHVAATAPPHLKHLQQQSMVQTATAVPRAPLDNKLDPGYHLELHPVYTDAYHIPAEAIAPWLQPRYLAPGMSRADYKRLTAGKGLPGVPGIGIPMPSYQPYLPMPVHSRRRRSTTRSDESVVSNQRDKRDKDDVAAKSSLERDALPVNDLPNQAEEKRVKTRQSTGTLLSMTPSEMYPLYHQQYHAVEMDPTQTGQQEAATSQQSPQMNQQQRATHVAVPRMALDNSQPTMIVQQPTEYRNAPDPRPSTFRVSLLPDTKRHTEHQILDKELVGASHDKVKQHVHQHMIIKNPQGSVTTGNYVSANPNGPSSVEQPVLHQTGQQVMQLYQDPNCAPAVQYVLAPQPCGSYMDNYVWAYQAAPSYSPMQICLQNADGYAPAVYQLV